MGKIVKYCSSCEESFAEKFSFCPNCASELSAFEMNPVEGNGKAAETKDQSETAPAVSKSAVNKEVPAIVASEAVVEETVFEPVDLLSESEAESMVSEDFEIEIPEDDPAESVPEISVEGNESMEIEEPEVFNETISVPTASPATQTEYIPYRASNANFDSDRADAVDGAYSVTVISERNSSVKNGLLLMSFTLICAGFFGVIIYSLFNNLDDIPALNQDPNLIAYLNDVPGQIEDLEEDKREGEKAGGGGGGGKNEDTPPSEGARPPMLRNPQFVPSAHSVRLTNPDIPIQQAIKGPIDETTRPADRYGVPGSLGRDTSDGPGTGGGIGTGDGQGVGPGRGGGFGPGSGGGMGGGNSGLGDGDGPGGRPRTAPPRNPPPVSGPSSPMQVLHKPRPGYTESARKNNVTGTVRLRVTFNSNGTIGSISPIKGLSDGLTEQAIAAARGIRFKPEMINGRAVSVSKTVVFNFTIY